MGLKKQLEFKQKEFDQFVLFHNEEMERLDKDIEDLHNAYKKELDDLERDMNADCA